MYKTTHTCWPFMAATNEVVRFSLDVTAEPLPNNFLLALPTMGELKRSTKDGPTGDWSSSTRQSESLGSRHQMLGYFNEMNIQGKLT